MHTTAIGKVPLRTWFSQALRTLRLERDRRQLFRHTYRELNRLSDRSLYDLGICRAEIPLTAEEAAHSFRQKKPLRLLTGVAATYPRDA